mmetsp:Transcript_16125/g.25806  ORF Transcript_16125/g.25806 Transcript_16125/m.25806 type:complete len:89 (-) Transcript_16125:40-306(-)
MLLRASGNGSILITCPGRNCSSIRFALPVPASIRPLEMQNMSLKDLTVRKFFSNGSKQEFPFALLEDVVPESKETVGQHSHGSMEDIG